MRGVKYVGPVRDHCYSDDTEVLTDSGWKLFCNLTYDDKLATLSEDHTLEYHYPDNIIRVPWEGELLNFFSSDGVDLLVSPNHNMFVQTESSARKYGQGLGGWKFERAEDCFGKSRYYKKTAPNYYVKGPSCLTIAGREINTFDWLKFLGYYLSEGSSTITKRKDYIVQLRQVKDEYALEDTADSLARVSNGKVNIGPDGRVIVNDKHLCLYLKETFGYCYDKYIPRYILNTCSREQLQVLYTSLVVGDGKITPEGETGGCYYATSSTRLKDDFQELQLKCGFSGDVSVAADPGNKTTLADGRVITATTRLWKISIRRKRSGTSLWSEKTQKSLNSPISNFKRISYKGEIFCATVKNHTLYVRRNGKAVWCGNSGYGEASRNYILALHKAGIPITVEPHCFEPNPPPVGTEEDRTILNSLINKDIDFDVVIVHLTPDLSPHYVKKYSDKYVVSYTVWETSKLHPKWVGCCNNVREVWVPSEWNVKAFKDSGVKVPVHKIHHGIDPNTYQGIDSSDFEISGVDKENTFIFTSVFQWNSRKNPDGLLRSYFNAFGPDDNVRLVLKTYVGRGLSSNKETQKIKEVINRVKEDMQLAYYPRVSLIVNPLPAEQLRALYLYSDAYVSLSHGEGFGLTSLEAGLAGKPVIMTGKGGNMEYMTENNSYCVPSIWDYAYGMATFNSWYLGDQQWARPNLVEASKIMRHVYENQAEAKEKGQKLRVRIINEFSWEAVAKQMINRLNEI